MVEPTGTTWVRREPRSRSACGDAPGAQTPCMEHAEPGRARRDSSIKSYSIMSIAALCYFDFSILYRIF
eukprot:COSAG02_NODE_3405_length_6797_cov_2.630188_8_plen_69_part_00